ncbi:efflux RND transporter periplasmic adaptor subunit [Chitinophaga solisilvae]|uniref:efflux RND transporter periplasmic adaptor subunit n=1 Tax=Chitinophaga solisilvae TaxID=1233460 RepID=UPI001370D361|nr:efflux RND transporter periplasmic adaptor subunit [Chitinophaga solisilvae]
MRNSYIVNISLLLTAVLLASCGQKQPPHKGHDAHQEPAMDKSVAGLTRSVNTHIVATIPAISPESGTRIQAADVNGVITYDTRNQTSIASRIAGRIERLLIKYNYQPVKRGQLIMEIYSPDLAAAQRELLYVATASPQLLTGAKQRLQLLGMQLPQIEQVLRTGNILYRIPVYSNADGYILEKSAAVATVAGTAAAPAASGDGMSSMGGGSAPAAAPAPTAPAATPVMLREGQYVNAGQPLFTIYQAESLVAEFAFPPLLAARIRHGQQLLFYPSADNNAMLTGSIGLIEPVFRNGENFTLARVYLRTHTLRPGQLLTASVPVVYTGGWWLPRKAVWKLGNQTIVFRKDKDTYLPAAVDITAEAGDMIQVSTAIGDWKVASNAAYLVDSESFIKMNNPQQ